VKTRLSVKVAMLSALFCAADAGAQQIKVLPKDSWVTDITPDGEIVVGSYDTKQHSSFIWRWRVDPAPTVIPGGDAVAVSDDGTVIAGNFPNGTPTSPNDDVAAIWTAATGWQTLGYLPGTTEGCGGGLSSAYDISGDGTTVVGLGWGTGCSGLGFRWTAATGMVPLQDLPNGGNRCSAISGDGSALGGFSQGNFARTPAYWKPDGSGSTLDLNLMGEVYDFTENGGLSVGTLYFTGTGNYYSAFVRNQQTGVITNLGQGHPGTMAAAASDISEDGQTIVGFDYFQFSREAWIWTPTDGIVSMTDKLTALGMTGLPKEFWVCSKCSDDGSVIVGGGLDPAGTSIAGFIVELQPSSPWTDLGHGLAGVKGVPALKGTGTLVPGSTIQLVLSNAKRGGVAAYFAGISEVDAPFKQGIMVPSLDFVLTNLPIDPTGKLSLEYLWPAGLPSGFSTYHQMWVIDPAGSAGFAASNALKGTTP
jgi:uncharacterized membrane protein